MNEHKLTRRNFMSGVATAISAVSTAPVPALSNALSLGEVAAVAPVATMMPQVVKEFVLRAIDISCDNTRRHFNHGFSVTSICSNIIYNPWNCGCTKIGVHLKESPSSSVHDADDLYFLLYQRLEDQFKNRNLCHTFREICTNGARREMRSHVQDGQLPPQVLDQMRDVYGKKTLKDIDSIYNKIREECEGGGISSLESRTLLGCINHPFLNGLSKICAVRDDEKYPVLTPFHDACDELFAEIVKMTPSEYCQSVQNAIELWEKDFPNDSGYLNERMHKRKKEIESPIKQEQFKQEQLCHEKRLRHLAPPMHGYTVADPRYVQPPIEVTN